MARASLPLSGRIAVVTGSARGVGTGGWTPVNNAGFAGPTRPVVAYPAAEWRRVMDVNLTGTFLACQAVGPALAGDGWDRVVNVASLAGKEGTPNAAACSASKAGVLALTSEPEDIAELVPFLCSGSRTFNTGAVSDVSGSRATY